MAEAIVYATDADYWLPTWVSLYSLLANNDDLDLDVYLLAEQEHPNYATMAEQIRSIHDRCRIHFVEVERSRLDDAAVHGSWSRANYQRLLIPELLPDSHDTALYLDGDTVVDGSVRPLLETDLDGALAAASPEYLKTAAVIGLPPEVDHFQTGVLLLNLDLWRERGIGRRALAHLRTTPSMPYPLQETLNVLLHREHGWRRVSPKFNVTNRWAITFRNNESLDPTVVHFTGDQKPWKYRYSPPYGDLWWSYLERSPCGPMVPEGRTIYEVLRKGLLTGTLEMLTRLPALRRIVSGLSQRTEEWEARTRPGGR